VFTNELSPFEALDIEHPTPPLMGWTLVFPEPGLPVGTRGGCLPGSSRSFESAGTIGLWLLFSPQAPSRAVTTSFGASPAMEVTLSRKGAKSRTRGRKLHLTGAKAGVGRPRRTRADLEQQLKACRREIAHARERVVEATKQQTATSEMLRIISNSPIQSVLDAVAENAARLCDANNTEIFRLEDSLLRLAASYGEIPVAIHAYQGVPVNRDTVTGRAAWDRRTIHVHDLAAEEGEYPVGSSNAKREGHRTTIATPLLREGTPIGIILARRMEIRPFSDKQIALLETFADQAVIAIENVRLFEAEKQRTQALAHANRDLAEREAKIRRLVEANIIGIFISGSKGRVLEANDAFLHVVGHDRDDLASGRISWGDLTPPEWRERDKRALAELSSNTIAQPYEKEFFRKDGSRVPVLIGGALFEEGGNEGVAFVLDLTARKRAEEALRESEAKFRDYAETASDWFWEIGPDYKFTLLTENAFGSDPAARIGTVCWDHVLDLETEPEKWRLVWETLDARKPFRDFVYCSVGGNGLPMYVKASGKPVFDANGEFRGYRGTGSDVTERRRAEEALRQSAQALSRSEAYLAEAQRLSHTGTWAFNETTTLYWSEESYRIWGFDPLHGLPSREAMWERVHPDDRDWVRQEARDARRQKRDYAVEHRILLPDGTVRYLEATAHFVSSADGGLFEVVGTHVDVTERKRAQEERERLRQLEADLAHMNRVSMMGELAASLAHEITQPIASARNNARAALNFLDQRLPDIGEVREAIDCVVGDSDRAGDIIDRIREHIKKAPPRKGLFDLNAAINEVIVLARSAISENGVAVRTGFADGLFPVEGDRVQVQQVLLNLILNAVEAMGSVAAGARELVISTEQTKTAGARVAVRDSGQGVDLEHLERVFEAFYTTKSSGTGMGLSICRSIIDAHGGRLWAEANEPRGAVFQFTLPGGERELTKPLQSVHRM
jgi:PAS domain S-box-containing protein